MFSLREFPLRFKSGVNFIFMMHHRRLSLPFPSPPGLYLLNIPLPFCVPGPVDDELKNLRAAFYPKAFVVISIIRYSLFFSYSITNLFKTHK